jgi:Na+/proline symporter
MLYCVKISIWNKENYKNLERKKNTPAQSVYVRHANTPLIISINLGIKLDIFELLRLMISYAGS